MMPIINGISIYTKFYITTMTTTTTTITTMTRQVRYTWSRGVEVREYYHDAMIDQDVVHIGYEADVAPHLLDTYVKKIEVKRFLNSFPL